MSKPEEVNRYRSGTKNPQQEVLVYHGKGKFVVHVIDWEGARVETLRKSEGESDSPPRDV